MRLLSPECHRHRNATGMLTDLQARSPDVAIGSYPFFRDSRYGTNLVIRSTDEGAIKRTVTKLKDALTRQNVEFQ